MAVSDNVKDPERQRDVLQEVFTKALARLESLRDPAQFRPWVLQIARNASIDDLRSRLSKPTDTIDDDEDQREVASIDIGPDEQAELRQLAVAIEQGVATLSSRDAAALSMAVHLGFGPEEIAAALDISYGNAKVVLHRARRRLRSALEQQSLLESVGGQS